VEYDKSLSRVVCTEEVNFHISGRVSRPNCAIWSSEMPKERLEHEQYGPKLNA
jgi:hypothetical protein